MKQAEADVYIREFGVAGLLLVILEALATWAFRWYGPSPKVKR